MASHLALALNILALTRPQVGFDGRVHKDPGLIQSCFDAACVHWNDTDGNRIEAHSAGMIQVHHLLAVQTHAFTLPTPFLCLT